MARVSLVMPVFDVGPPLGEAVESALAQRFGDFELLVVDDGSTDPVTVAILDRLRDPRIRVLRAAHQGVVAARNLAISQARGEYLSFFDADDKMDPGFLERTVGALDADPQLAFVSCWVRLFGEESWDWRAESCDLVTLLHDCSVATPALVRRAIVQSVGGFDPVMEHGHEDWDLWLTIVERGHRGAILPEVLFHYRRRAGSRSTIADRGGTYLELYRDRVRKHAASYQANLFDLLWTKENAIGQNWRAIEQARTATRGREQDLARIRAELDERRRELEQRLEALLARAHGEIHALRRSRSWQVTRPMRQALEWVRERWKR